MGIRDLANTFRIVMRNIGDTDKGDVELLAVQAKRAADLWQEMLWRGFEFKDDGSHEERR
jgi:hypothetical protein